MENQFKKGMPTPYKDIDGEVIKLGDYFINSLSTKDGIINTVYQAKFYKGAYIAVDVEYGNGTFIDLLKSNMQLCKFKISAAKRFTKEMVGIF